MQGGHVGKPAARRDDSKRSSGLASEEKQARVVTRRFRFLLGFGVDVMEDRSTGARVFDHAIERRDDDNGIDLAVVWEERPDTPERHGCVVASVIPRQ